MIWRIGVGFIALIMAMLGVQSVMISYAVSRSTASLPGRSPNNFASIVAHDVGAALSQNSNLDLRQHLMDRYGAVLSPVFVVMKDGRIVGNTEERLADNQLHAAEASLGGIAGRAKPRVEASVGPPVVTAPIEVGSALVGMVVVPPRMPAGGTLWDVRRFISVPGVVLLLLATLAATLLIVAPARRRLRDLEITAARIGAGDWSVRASERGGDEVARLARAFNRMAADLAARDDAVRVSDRLRRQMLADVSHELKTPLTSMRGYLETLHMPEVAVEPATRDRYIDTIRQETLRLERIVQDLLDLARFENDPGSLSPRLFALERLFQRVCQRYERIAAARRVTLAWDVAPAADQIVGDPDRLEQAIDNLVANALRHSPDGGRVTVSATTDDAGAAISVVDQGRGIPPEHLPYVFDRFYRADAGRSAASGGSGLGLSIVKAIVERHGGTVEVSSVPGRTAFTVRLPQQLDIDVHELIADAPGRED